MDSPYWLPEPSGGQAGKAGVCSGIATVHCDTVFSCCDPSRRDKCHEVPVHCGTELYRGLITSDMRLSNGCVGLDRKRP
jgi:hypothetical protein